MDNSMDIENKRVSKMKIIQQIPLALIQHILMIKRYIPHLIIQNNHSRYRDSQQEEYHLKMKIMISLGNWIGWIMNILQ